jgi:hypothetical protein
MIPPSVVDLDAEMILEMLAADPDGLRCRVAFPSYSAPPSLVPHWCH